MNDVPDFGLLRLRRATGIYGAGRSIDPTAGRPQMTGGIAWRRGMAASRRRAW